MAELLSPWEIELLCYVPDDCPIEEMKIIITSDSTPDLERLWKILEKFTPPEKIAFLKFGTGRSGLPPPGSNWKSKLKIDFVTSGGSDIN